MIISNCHYCMIFVWGMVGWELKATFLQGCIQQLGAMESWRDAGLPLRLCLQDCLGWFHWLGGLMFVLNLIAERRAQELVVLSVSVASQQHPIEDAIEHGSWSVTGEHIRGSPSAHQAHSMPNLEGSII
eukprot:1160738-Pelagomonas_calceolata.AAC.2